MSQTSRVKLGKWPAGMARVIVLTGDDADLYEGRRASTSNS